MLDEQRAFELSRLYVSERLAAAEKERLLRSVGHHGGYLSEFAAWAGSALVRMGRRLETVGGAPESVPSFEMRRRAV